ncbi:hypothetical protein CPB84DRAFT_1758320 [Gymnopilus junonius]|uniref:Uncharacterized protein n=1 Tax=Gymnopilus junonius TaxID=109634 RepID=A0A9P5P360_GYMJU|nr:hypothetical protein CPB84DRAFT_1758320 [Gymnopilus junonius]
MARILPRLVGRLERQGKQQTVFPFRAPKRKRQSLFTPPLPPPSFRPADHPQTILLSHNIHYVRHKSRPPSLSQPQISASVPPDPPRQMTPAEFAWWSNPYHLLIRLVGMQVPPTRLPSGKRSVAQTLEQLERGGYKRLSPDLSLYPNLMHHIAHLLQFRLLADSLWFAVRTHQRLGIPNPILRRLTREEWGLMRTTGSLPYQNAVAVLIVPPVNKDVTTKRRPTPSFSSLPPQDEHCPPTLPPTSTLLDSSVKSPNDLPDAISSLQIPLYNSVSAFPSRSQRAALHSLLLRILDAERYLKYLHLQRGESFSEKHLHHPRAATPKRGDPAAVARALWRLRMYDSEGWSGSLL